MPRTVKELEKAAAELALDVGVALIDPLFKALARGDVAAAERTARIVAETSLAKGAIRAARKRAGR